MKSLPPTRINRLSIASPITQAIAFLVFIAIPVLLYTAYTWNNHNQNNLIQESKAQFTQGISKKITELNSVMSSLIGLHYASIDLEDSKISQYAKELRSQTDFIKEIGRYDYVTDSDRPSFEDRMSERGLFNFKITDINNDGLLKPRAKQDSYFPISMLEPFVPEKIRLLGLDLSANKDLNIKLYRSTALNSALLADLPAQWPSDGNVIMFAPVYRGKAAPSLPSSRIDQSAGGYWISVDMDAFVASTNQNQRRFDITTEIKNVDSSKMVFAQLGIETEPSYLSSVYTRDADTKYWSIGSTSITFSLLHDKGFSKASLAFFLASFVVIVALTVLYTVYILSRRSAVADQLKAQAALFQERERAENTLNTVQDAIISLDSDMRVIHVNPAAISQFKTADSNPVGRSLDNFVKFRVAGDGFTTLNFKQALENVPANSKTELDVVPIASNDSDLVLRLTISSSINQEGTVTGHVLVLRDISEERRLTKKLDYQANHDALTGCTNRHFFENTLSGLVNSLPDSNSKHTLCYLDLDQFKVINDTCGHSAGDQLLIDLTTNLKLIVSDSDVLSRLGGDEFGLIIRNVDETEGSLAVQRIYEFFQNYVFQYDNKAFAVRASIGVVHLDKTSNNLKDVLASADIACYAAKDSGRNCVSVYSDSDNAVAARSKELRWLPRLRQALEKDEFTLLVQAVGSVEALCNNAEKPITHYEFLIRLENPDGSLSTPWQFVQAAERYGLMTDIDRWVIRNAFRTVSELDADVCNGCSFSINLSGQSAAEASMKDYIKEQLEFYQIDASRIWFEITETAAISNFSVAVDLFNNIRSLGSLIALDDFGSGLSSFGYLKNLPVDILKIDGQFVKEIAKNPIDREMVRAIHQVGQSMGIQSVAEFVEDEEILQVLSEIGVQYAQGYHIGKPMSIGEATELQQSHGLQKAA